MPRSARRASYRGEREPPYRRGLHASARLTTMSRALPLFHNHTPSGPRVESGRNGLFCPRLDSPVVADCLSPFSLSPIFGRGGSSSYPRASHFGSVRVMPAETGRVVYHHILYPTRSPSPLWLANLRLGLPKPSPRVSWTPPRVSKTLVGSERAARKAPSVSRLRDGISPDPCLPHVLVLPHTWLLVRGTMWSRIYRPRTGRRRI